MKNLQGVTSVLNEESYVVVTSLGVKHLFLKLESMNPSGSIKLKAAIGMVEAAEHQGLIKSETMLIESSSGSLGVALSMIAAQRGYAFTCVVDPNLSPQNLKMMKALGARIVKVGERDANGGFLGTRIRYIQEAIQADPAMLWLNQYANPENPGAHYRTTAPAISRAFPRLDYLFIGAGTTGTLMGCSKYFSEHRPDVKIIAVDSVGSVTFGHAPGKRFIPGLGTSRRPEIFRSVGLHAQEMIPEVATVQMCRHLARSEGLLLGGSTGTVLAAVFEWRRHIAQDAVVVAISPDMGERYLDTVYNDDWICEKFGPASLASLQLGRGASHGSKLLPSTIL